jgi:hypothetical protein
MTLEELEIVFFVRPQNDSGASSCIGKIFAINNDLISVENNKNQYDYHLLTPIPVTLGVLQRNGFKIEAHEDSTIYDLRKEEYKLKLNQESGVFQVWLELQNKWSDKYEGIHLLQKMYFDITGRYLDLKFPIKILIDLIDLESTNSDDIESMGYLYEYVYEKEKKANEFNDVFRINKGNDNCKLMRLQEIIIDICKQYNKDEDIVIHFLGHGSPNQISFIKYEQLSKLLNKIAEKHSLFINLMNTCYSNGLAKYKCYNTLWCTTGKINDVYSPFIFYHMFSDDVYMVDFNAFKERWKVQNVIEYSN